MPASVHASASAAGLLALLAERDDTLKERALTHLNKSVDSHWFEISSSIASLEALYEDDGFSHRQLAALVASKASRWELGERNALTGKARDSIICRCLK